MIIIDDFRLIILSELGTLWKYVQKEVHDYFGIIDFADITYRKNYHKLHKPEEVFLNNPLNIPEVYTLLYSIKENNFNYFDSNSETLNYNHYERAYFIRDNLLIQLEPIVERVKNFRIENFNKILKSQIKIKNEEKFIVHRSKNYGLEHYDLYIDIINKIAYHNDFYSILPILLRCLFENLLYDIFQVALDKKHTTLFFSKKRARARDFSQLIALLNILKDKSFKPYHKDSINQNIIDILIDIKKFGNWTVHQVLMQVDKDFVNRWKHKVNSALLTLLVLYEKVKGKAIEITDKETKRKIIQVLNVGKLTVRESQNNAGYLNLKDIKSIDKENLKFEKLFVNKITQSFLVKDYYQKEYSIISGIDFNFYIKPL